MCPHWQQCFPEPLLLPVQVPGKSAVRFFVASQGPVDPPAAAELKAHSDFVWLDVPHQQNYRTIGDSTLKVFQHVVETYDFSFVLKVGS